ncbi:MAG TPA: EamA family transporter [Acidobacteriaceae bacterium]
MSPHTKGLLLAVACSTTNVGMDVAQKKALLQRPYLTTIVAIRIWVFLALTATVIVRQWMGHPAPWHVIPQQGLFHIPYFAGIAALDCCLVALSSLFYYRAIQIAPLSLTIPFLTFTPVFLLLSTEMVLRERPSLLQIEAVAVVVFGSLLMYRAQFHMGWIEPIRALATNPGSRYMLLASLILSLTNVLDKWLILRTDSFTFAWIYGLGSCIVFGIGLSLCLLLGKVKLEPLSWNQMAVAGIADAATLIFQFAALQYLSAVATIAFKRSGILLTVLAGWFFFHEKQVANRLVAAAIMISGALMLHLSFTLPQQTCLLLLALVAGITGPRIIAAIGLRRHNAANDPTAAS